MADRFGSIRNYNEFLRSFPRMQRLFRGNFYAFTYDFDLNQRFEKIKYWDLVPLIFVTGRIKSKKNIIQGINFHHLPINIRLVYLNLIKKISTAEFENDRRLVRLAKYEALFKMFRKATKFGVRNYDMRNIKGLRKVPNSNIEEALRYYARTYYGINISNVEKNYLMFRI